MSARESLFGNPSLDNSPLTTDLPVQSVEPSVKQLEAATPVLSVKNNFKRQMGLFKHIRSAQQDCENEFGHSLITRTKDIILCTDCGALWIR